MPEELKAGPTMDMAVGEAAGIEVTMRTVLSPEAIAGTKCVCRGPFCPHDNRKKELCWNPSGNIRHAMEAAEKVGLFEDYVLRQHPSRLLCEGSRFCIYGLWAMCRIGLDDEGFPDYFDFTPNDYSTPALAICAAILKLKENNE